MLGRKEHVTVTLSYSFFTEEYKTEVTHSKPCVFNSRHLWVTVNTNDLKLPWLSELKEKEQGI